jgi:4'-phosphopantetheinyl transferase
LFSVRVGVDVMRHDLQKNTSEFFRLMRRKFTDNEWNCIEQQAGDLEKLRSFYRHWSLKESFVKADGAGLSWDLRRLDFRVSLHELKEKMKVSSSFIAAQNFRIVTRPSPH